MYKPRSLWASSAIDCVAIAFLRASASSFSTMVLTSSAVSYREDILISYFHLIFYGKHIIRK